MTARKIVRRAAQLPAEVYAAASGYLSETLDWLNLWHSNHAPVDEPLADLYTEQQYPSLDL